MRYFVLEQKGNKALPASSKGEEAEVIQASDLGSFAQIDYDARSGLISDRLKNVIALYMPDYDFQPVVYLDVKKSEDALFWKFRPPIYEGVTASYKNNGSISCISSVKSSAPPSFTVRSPKGVRWVIVEMPLAESVLRRLILGLKFTRV